MRYKSLVIHVSALVMLLAIFAACAALWHIAEFRPYLVAGGTGLAAFLGPIPGLVSPDLRGKWLISIFIAAMIATATGMATMDLNDQLFRTEKANGRITQRFNALNDSVEALINGQRPAVQEALLAGAAGLYKKQFRDGRYQALLDLARLMLAIQGDNGHGLYYVGETYRVLGNRTEMLGNFQNYLAAADHHPEARNGDASECYQRATGFCQERYAWIDHELANMYLDEASSEHGAAQLDDVRTSLEYEGRELEVRPAGFPHDNHMRSSCTLATDIASELRINGKETLGADAAVRKACTPIK